MQRLLAVHENSQPCISEQRVDDDPHVEGLAQDRGRLHDRPLVLRHPHGEGVEGPACEGVAVGEGVAPVRRHYADVGHERAGRVRAGDEYESETEEHEEARHSRTVCATGHVCNAPRRRSQDHELQSNYPCFPGNARECANKSLSLQNILV